VYLPGGGLLLLALVDTGAALEPYDGYVVAAGGARYEEVDTGALALGVYT